MAIDYDIGGKKFILITGQPTGFQEDLEVVARPGVPGVQVIWLDKRSEMFKLFTIVDCESLADGDTKFQNYENMVGLTYTPLIIAGHDYTGSHNAKLLIRRVKKTSLQRIHSIVGGINNNSTALLMAEWDVQLLKILEN
jgi:hypothetical protein